jgi:hypothetical protein
MYENKKYIYFIDLRGIIMILMLGSVKVVNTNMMAVSRQ